MHHGSSPGFGGDNGVAMGVRWIEWLRGKFDGGTGLHHAQPMGNARCDEHQVARLQREFQQALPVPGGVQSE